MESDSILLFVKDTSGVNVEDDAFDSEILIHINSAFSTLRQLGVGPDSPFIVNDSNTTWDEFTTDDSIISMVKSYIVLKVRYLFDPPTSSSLATAMKETISEYEWRLAVEVDNSLVSDGGG